jgi:hypothetical protein
MRKFRIKVSKVIMKIKVICGRYRISEKIESTDDLLQMLKKSKWMGNIERMIVRNQVEQKSNLKTKE